jgi:hypothetical protein
MPYRVSFVSGRKELRDFLKLPFKVYAGDSSWVPPLRSEIKRTIDRKTNPYFRNADIYLLNCYRDNEIASRIAVIINNGYTKEFGRPIALFGFFESLDDLNAARNLFDVVTDLCKKKGVDFIIGPFNPNHYSELGLQVTGFGTPPTFFQTYNPSYYCGLLNNCGFSLNRKLHTRKRENIKEYLEKTYDNRKIPVPEGFRIRPFDPKNKAEELEKLRNIYNDAFESNTYFLPVSRDEYIFSAKYLSLVTDPGMLVFAEYNGDTVGAIQFAYDINPLLKKFKGKAGPIKYFRFIKERRNIDKVIVFAIGIKKASRNTRIIQLLLTASIDILKNFKTLEATWMTEDNLLAIKSAERLGLEPDKEFAILSKEL